MISLQDIRNMNAIDRALRRRNIRVQDFQEDAHRFFADSNFQVARTFSDFKDPASLPHHNQSIFYAPSDRNILRQLIGKKGCHFIDITNRSKCEHIWHDKKYNTITITSNNKQARFNAMRMIIRRIDHLLRYKHHITNDIYTPAPLI